MLEIGICGLVITLSIVVGSASLGPMLDRGILAGLAVMLPGPG